jgi:UPF0755 protein
MAVKSRKKMVSLFIVILIVLVSVGLIVGYFVINAAVIEQFGRPSKNLTFTQRLIYPLELYFNSQKLTSPTDLAGIGQTFMVDQGESVSMVCFRLEQMGLIDDAELLRIYLVYSGLDRHLKSGHFKLSSAMSPFQIAQEFLDVIQKDAIVTILPGWRIEEVAANVAGSGLAITAEEFIQAAYAPSFRHLAYLPIDDAASLEGFLFPGSYVVPREFDLDSLLEVVLTEFNHQVDETLMDGFARQGLTTYEAVNLASIIEKEAVVDGEKPMIASVLFNRLAEGMQLQTDPTVQYALGFQSATQTWWKSPLSLDDLTINSPYNTYTALGLPPTPICNPDLGSLRAVAFPAETPYNYFRAACDGSGRHNFAITFEEHLNNACE